MKNLSKILFIFLFSLNFHEVRGDFPDFNLKHLNKDGYVSKNPLLTNKLILIDFWAQWCAPCRKSLPVYQELANTYGKNGLKIVAINVDSEINLAQEFIANIGFNPSFIILRDGQSLAQTLNIETMPTSYLIDSSGKIIFEHQGFVEGDREKLMKLIEENLK